MKLLLVEHAPIFKNLKLEKAALLKEKTLKKEKTADEKLTEVAVSVVNVEAIKEKTIKAV